MEDEIAMNESIEFVFELVCIPTSCSVLHGKSPHRHEVVSLAANLASKVIVSNVMARDSFTLYPGNKVL